MKIIMHFNYIKIAKADTSCNEENKSISEKSRRNNFTFFQFATRIFLPVFSYKISMSKIISTRLEK